MSFNDYPSHRNIDGTLVDETTYGVCASISQKVEGWENTKHLPTFYLKASIQGILSETHGEKIARKILDPLETHGENLLITVVRVP